jgi:hypothetical protein
MRVHRSLERTDGLIGAIVMLLPPLVVGGTITFLVEHSGDERQQCFQRLKVGRLA